jgi:oligosaccharide amylase
MVRNLVLGNGNVLICIDDKDRVRDFYYPYVGQENHVNGNIQKTGIFVDGHFSWLDSPEWQITLSYKKNSLVSFVKARNEKLQIEIGISEAVHFDKNVFVREFDVKNKSERTRKFSIFFNQNLHISEANIGDTVYYNPFLKSIVNYKGKRYFLFSGAVDGKGIHDYATGEAEVGGKLGTWVDAEDGKLSKNPIEHGSVDSTISLQSEVPKGASKKFYYWIAVGERLREVKDLNNFVKKKKPANVLGETEEYWKRWSAPEKIKFYDLSESVETLFRRSLMVVRAQTDNRGAIIAASDSDLLFYKKDTYNYMWPRDGALIARSLDRVGHREMTKRFFRFCSQAATNEGYLLHKYRPDGSMGSSWHPWVNRGKIQLPIQEDETALILDAIWKWYIQYKDKKFIREIYPFIKKSGDFLNSFIDKKTHLPKETYHVWEEKLGIHTFTCSTVYAGLEASKHFALLFKKKTDAKKYEKTAIALRNSVLKYLWDENQKSFIKRIYYDENGKIQKDFTVDISTGYGIFEYKVLGVDDKRVESTIKLILERLSCRTPVGGVARYDGDAYHRKTKEVPGNPWFISTLWIAEYYIANAKTVKDLSKAKELLDWVVERALPTGILAEQINPLNGFPVSVSPLTWSHAGFIIAVVKYTERYEELSGKKGKKK